MNSLFVEAIQYIEIICGMSNFLCSFFQINNSNLSKKNIGKFLYNIINTNFLIYINKTINIL